MTHRLLVCAIATFLGFLIAGSASAELAIAGRLNSGDDLTRRGGRVTIFYRITNLSKTRYFDDPTVGIYLSTDVVFDESDIFIETDKTSDLDPGESDSESEQITVPNVVDGYYFLLVVVDRFDRIDEINEDDNQLTLPIIVGYPGPPGALDLTIDPSRYSAYFVRDGNDPSPAFFIDYAIQNLGTGFARDPNVVFFVSSDRELSEDDFRLGGYFDETLGPERSVLEGKYFEVPSDVEGAYLLIYIDANNRYAETDETNNVGVFQFREEASTDDDPVATTADLRVDRFSRDRDQRRRTNDQSLEFGFRVFNAGVDPSVPTNLVIGLEPVEDSSYFFPLEAFEVPALNRRRGEVFSASLPMAGIPHGRYIVRIIADEQDQMIEPNETNNIRSFRVRIK